MKRSRLRSVSKKRQRERPAFDAVYAEVNQRSRGLCELDDHGVHRASEHHHLFKPGRGTCEGCGVNHPWGHHRAENILHVCGVGHAEFDRPYRIGRRVPTTFDAEMGRCRTEMVYAADKFEARREKLVA